MSRYIGKRVSYTCGFCKKLFTLNKKSVDDSEKSGEVFCSKECNNKFYSSVCSGYAIKFDEPDINGIVFTKNSFDYSQFDKMKERGDIVDYSVDERGIKIIKRIGKNDLTYTISPISIKYFHNK